MGKDLSLIAKGAGLYFAGFAVSKVLAFLYRVIVARGLGPDSFGIFSIGISVTGIILVFAALGLYQGILHFVAVYDTTGNEAKARGTILLGLKAQLVSSIAFAAIIFVSADYIAVSFFREPEVALVIRIMSMALPFAVLTSALMIVVQAFKKIEYKICVRNFIENIAKVCFTGLLLFFGFELFGATLGLALSSVVAFIVSIFLVQKKVFPLFGPGLKVEYNARELFSYSWPLLAVGFFSIIMSSIDTVMLGHLAKAYDAGIYNVAQPTANLLLIASFAFVSLFLPIITGLYAQKKMGEMQKMFKVVSRWVFSLIFPCMLFMVLFAGEILTVMFGPVFAMGAGAMIILALGIFMVSFVGPAGSILESVRRTKLIFVNTVICGLLNVGLNLWLIPLFALTGNAIIGAAIATSFSYFLWNLLSLAEVFILTRMHPYSRAYLSPTAAGCIAIALTYFAKQVLPPIEKNAFPFDFAILAVSGLAFLSLYALLFLLLKGLQPEDLEVLKAAEQRTGFKSKPVRDFLKRFS